MNFFKPLLAGTSFTDRAIACMGATIGITLTIVITSGMPLMAADFPLIVAPLGASAVLVFAVPSSPLAQPWPVIGGNVISSLVGVAVYKAIPNVTIAAGVAVGAAILIMSLLRCLHPPGGAAALTVVIGSESIHMAGYGFAFAPVAINSIVLVAVALAFHRVAADNYPHVPAAMPVSRFEPADIQAALDDMDESFDVAREDLWALLAHAERHATERGAKR